mgnify:CR=1 FL=1
MIFRSAMPKCDECGETILIPDQIAAEHYCSGANHGGYPQDVGLFCPLCIRGIKLNDAIELRKASQSPPPKGN